jgi:hypothetical protein
VPPRPKIIDRLFEARHEYETALFSTKAQAEKKYLAVLEEAATQYGCEPAELRSPAWMAEFYRDWMVENGLRKRNRRV